MPGKPIHQEPEVGFGMSFTPPRSVNIKTLNTLPARMFTQLGVFGTSRYGRATYGFQPAAYGVDKYGESTYD